MHRDVVDCQRLLILSNKKMMIEVVDMSHHQKGTNTQDHDESDQREEKRRDGMMCVRERETRTNL
jgi:hypothetical protein